MAPQMMLEAQGGGALSVGEISGPSGAYDKFKIQNKNQFNLKTHTVFKSMNSY